MKKTQIQVYTFLKKLVIQLELVMLVALNLLKLRFKVDQVKHNKIKNLIQLFNKFMNLVYNQ